MTHARGPDARARAGARDATAVGRRTLADERVPLSARRLVGLGDGPGVHGTRPLGVATPAQPDGRAPVSAVEVFVGDEVVDG